MSKIINRLNVIDNRLVTDRPAIFFIHSLAGSCQQWEAQTAFFWKTHRVIAFDLPGHGQSQQEMTAGITIEQVAEMVLAAADEMQVERFFVAGHSFGGSVAVAIAGMAPERVSALILVDASGDASQIPAEAIEPFMQGLDSPAYSQVIEGYWEENLAGSKEETRTAVIETLRQTAPQTVLNSFKGLLAFDPVQWLKRYAGPKYALITQHNETPMSLQNLVEIPFDKIEACGHWLQLDQPELVNRHIKGFIDSTI